MAFIKCNDVTRNNMPDTFSVVVPVSVAMTYFHATGADDRDSSSVSMNSSGASTITIGDTKYNVSYSGSGHRSGGKTSSLSASGSITITFKKAS